MREALFYKQLKNKLVRCELCPKYCVITPNNSGNCNTRKNINGKLYSLVYGKPVSVAIDPIEKKPLYHFLPGSKAFSIGTTGCNLYCKFCQNYETSQAKPDEFFIKKLSPLDVVKEAVKSGCSCIAYTYNEPTTFYEYVLETAKISKKKGLKNIIVTNGFINLEPIKELYPHIDGVNIDLKSFNEDFYKNICSASLKPVLEAIKLIKKYSWIELTNLIIPGLNDDFKDIRKMVLWIKRNLNSSVPLHFSRFFPCYQMKETPATPLETLNKAYLIAKKELEYVYLGNVKIAKGNNTYCPKCNSLVIERDFYTVKNHLRKNKCFECGAKVGGIFE